MKHLALCVASISIVLSSGIAANAADLPDPDKTPGCAIGEPCSDNPVAIKLSVLCVPGYTQGVRNVPSHEKTTVYKEYGITSRSPGEYEVDHLISLELGGSNDIKNLWPQSYITCPWNAHVKDKFENYLHSQVCKGKLSLGDAQSIIRTDWIAGYRKLIGDLPECADGK